MRRHFSAHSGLCASALGNAKPLMCERGAPGATPSAGIETPTPSDLLPAGVAIPSPLLDPAQRRTGHDFSEVQRSNPKHTRGRHFLHSGTQLFVARRLWAYSCHAVAGWQRRSPFFALRAFSWLCVAGGGAGAPRSSRAPPN